MDTTTGFWWLSIRLFGGRFAPTVWMSGDWEASKTVFTSRECDRVWFDTFTRKRDKRKRDRSAPGTTASKRCFLKKEASSIISGKASIDLSRPTEGAWTDLDEASDDAYT